jgi:DHA1 family tetracycline resistance protein-like MFS transporter
MLYLFILVYALSGLVLPALQSLIAKGVPSSEQGELQGTLVSLSSLSAVFSPLIYTEIFEYFTQSSSSHTFAGAAYLTSAIIAAIAWFCWYSSSKKFR